MSVPQRFGVLRLIGTLLKVVAWIVLVSSIVLALLVGLAFPVARQFAGDAGLQPDLLALGSAGGLIAGVLLMLAGVVIFLICYAAGENIFLRLAIEENTRMTAALLLRSAGTADPVPGGPSVHQTYYGEVME
jgi:hypothetical protein